MNRHTWSEISFVSIWIIFTSLTVTFTSRSSSWFVFEGLFASTLYYSIQRRKLKCFWSRWIYHFERALTRLIIRTLILSRRSESNTIRNWIERNNTSHLLSFFHILSQWCLSIITNQNRLTLRLFKCLLDIPSVLQNSRNWIFNLSENFYYLLFFHLFKSK
jgi:hypothetical protein